MTFIGGARIEIMHRLDVIAASGAAEGKPPRYTEPEVVGIAHFAFDVGTAAEVDAMTERLRNAGVPIVAEPRRTGDGFYESVVADPDGNRIEIVGF